MASYYSFFVCLFPIIIKIISKTLAVAYKALAARHNLKCISTHFARNLKEEKNNDDQSTLNKIERGLRSCTTFLQPSLMMLSVSFTALHSQCFPPLDPSTWAPHLRIFAHTVSATGALSHILYTPSSPNSLFIPQVSV